MGAEGAGGGAAAAEAVRGLLGAAAPRSLAARGEWGSEPVLAGGSWEREGERWQRRPEPDSGGGGDSFWAGAFGLKALLRTAIGLEAQELALEWGADVNAVRFRGGQKEVLNGAVGPEADDESAADAASLERLYIDKGCTLQVHQPQRWSDALWEACAALEEDLQCLAGCNAYITPPHSQGLAPHFDDVELWVCQTEGSKRWRVYGPHPMAYHGVSRPEPLRHACCSSGDLDREELEAMGLKLLLEVDLKVGDVLYIPRGFIHEARATTREGSCHVTISTFQRWCPAEALRQGLGRAMAVGSPALPECLRQGLPVGSGVLDSDTSASTRVALATGLRQMADALIRGRTDVSEGSRSLDTIFDVGAREMHKDFMTSRLPPHPSQLPFSRWVEPQSEDDTIFPIRSGLLDIRLASSRLNEPFADECEKVGLGSSDNGLMIRITTCRGNRREAHMMPDGAVEEEGAVSEGEGAGDVDEEDPEAVEETREEGYGLLELDVSEREQVEMVFNASAERQGVRVGTLYEGRPGLGLCFAKMLFQHGLVNAHAPRESGKEGGGSSRKRARHAK